MDLGFGLYGTTFKGHDTKRYDCRDDFVMSDNDVTTIFTWLSAGESEVSITTIALIGKIQWSQCRLHTNTILKFQFTKCATIEAEGMANR